MYSIPFDFLVGNVFKDDEYDEHDSDNEQDKATVTLHANKYSAL